MKNNLRFLLLPLLVSSFNIGSAHALVGSANANTFLGMNYGEEVLNAVLENWKNPDSSVTGTTAITVRIAQDGRPYSCEIRRKSSSEVVDNSICQAIAEIGHFTPLKGLDSGEVYLSFVHDNKPYLDLKTVTEPAIIEEEETIDSVKNPIDNPIKEIQKQADINLDSEQLIDKDVAIAQNTPTEKENTAVNKESLATAVTATAATTATVTQSTTEKTPKNNDNNKLKTKTNDNTNTTNEIKTLEYTDDDPYAKKIEKPETKKVQETKENKQKNIKAEAKNEVKGEVKEVKKVTEVQKEASPTTKKIEETNTIKENEKVYPPISTEKQPQTLVISRKEALQPPSKNLVDPSASVKDYSNYILQEATPHFRFPSGVHGNFQIVARLDLLADGTLEKVTINKSSDIQALDDEVLRVLKTKINYPPVPSKNKQSLWLTFNIKK